MGRTPRKAKATAAEELDVVEPVEPVEAAPATPSKQVVEEAPCTPAKMKVNELKEALIARGLSPKGLKKELVERLAEALQSHQPSHLAESHTADQLAEEDGGEANGVEDLKEPEEKVAEPTSKKAKTKNEEAKKEPVGAVVAEKEKEPEKEEEQIDYSAEEVDECTKSNKTSAEAQELTSTSWTPRAKAVLKAPGPSAVVHITGFVRPLMVPAAKELVERFGIVNHFWMDAIKSQAYVAYEDCEMSRDCRDGLEGMVWPAETGKALSVEYSTLEALKAAAEAESQRQQSKAANPPPVAAAAPPPAPAATEAVKLDELFHKTKALPHLYYKPALPL